MTKLPSVKGKGLVKFVESLGFNIIRIKGSHIRLKAKDERITTIPVHANKDIPKGLLRKIIREDLKISLDEFLDLYLKYIGK
ncbi:MAG: type II toxin-antitoxin system HicA family toxin [Candidatus Hydromicrobium sp.]|nr:type II toxin-antitoxin system HicA family toxin [Candidatus Hydromicrobium sp.]